MHNMGDHYTRSILLVDYSHGLHETNINLFIPLSLPFQMWLSCLNFQSTNTIITTLPNGIKNSSEGSLVCFFSIIYLFLNCVYEYTLSVTLEYLIFFLPTMKFKHFFLPVMHFKRRLVFGKVRLEDEQSLLHTYIYSYPVYASLSLQIPFPFACKIKKNKFGYFLCIYKWTYFGFT